MSYRSSLAPELSRFELETRLFIRNCLKEESMISRAQFQQQQLSGPPGLNRRTGNLYRSFRITVTSPTKVMRMTWKIGGERAPYALKQERRGRLRFNERFEEFSKRTLVRMQAGLNALRGGGQSRGVSFALRPENALR